MRPSHQGADRCNTRFALLHPTARRRSLLLHVVQEGLGVDLDEAERAIAQPGEIDVEIADMVEREAVAERAVLQSR